MDELNKFKEFLIDYVTDEETADLIIKGGEQGFYYGNGGYLVFNSDNAEELSTFNEYAEDDYMVIDDESLTYKYVIGSLD